MKKTNKTQSKSKKPKALNEVELFFIKGNMELKSVEEIAKSLKRGKQLSFITKENIFILSPFKLKYNKFFSTLTIILLNK